MNKFYIYEYYIIDTGEVFYVGKGKGKRIKSGKRNKFCEDMKNTHNWNYRIVKNDLTENDAFNLEKNRVKYYKLNTNYRLTNQTNGGEGISGWKAPKEFKEKQSKIHKDMWEKQDYKNKIIKIRNDKNSSYKSKEFRDKISKLVKGEKNPNFNNHWSNEQKKSLSKKRIELGLGKSVKNGRAKK